MASKHFLIVFVPFLADKKQKCYLDFTVDPDMKGPKEIARNAGKK